MRRQLDLKPHLLLDLAHRDIVGQLVLFYMSRNPHTPRCSTSAPGSATKRGYG